ALPGPTRRVVHRRAGGHLHHLRPHLPSRYRRRAGAPHQKAPVSGGVMAHLDILYGKKDGIAWITINRPEVRNAFRTRTVRELTEAFEDAKFDPTVGVVVLTGAGDKAFCAGGDQKERGQEGYARDERPMDV